MFFVNLPLTNVSFMHSLNSFQGAFKEIFAKKYSYVNVDCIALINVYPLLHIAIAHCLVKSTPTVHKAMMCLNAYQMDINV